MNKQTLDGLTRTDWFDENIDPTIAGPYECTTTTNGGYVCLRTWTGATWISNVTGAPSNVRLPWRGVVPGSVDPMRYPLATRVYLADTRAEELIAAGHKQYAKEGNVAPSETHALAIGALYS